VDNSSDLFKEDRDHQPTKDEYQDQSFFYINFSFLIVPSYLINLKIFHSLFVLLKVSSLNTDGDTEQTVVWSFSWMDKYLSSNTFCLLLLINSVNLAQFFVTFLPL